MLTGADARKSQLWPVPVRVGGVLIGVCAAVLAIAEAAHWLASHRMVGADKAGTGREAVVVLGFRNRGEHANAVNRFRLRAGMRSLSPRGTETVLVLCGGAVAGSTSEAEIMARYARGRLGYSGPILLDPCSRTTEENIRNAIPLIEDADTIKIVSNSMHAAHGRAMLWEQRPDLAERLRRGDDYRFGEQPLLKAYATLRSARRHMRMLLH